MTSILVSAEMIRSRGSIKSVYERARKLSPSLIIVEDIDTTGGMDRRVADHPLLQDTRVVEPGDVPACAVAQLVPLGRIGQDERLMTRGDVTTRWEEAVRARGGLRRAAGRLRAHC